MIENCEKRNQTAPYVCDKCNIGTYLENNTCKTPANLIKGCSYYLNETEC